MKQKTYRFLNRLVDKITSKDCPNNDYFEYYGHKVTLQSGTHDFVDVTISDMDNRNQITFSFDFWTKELCFDGYNNYDESLSQMSLGKKMKSSIYPCSIMRNTTKRPFAVSTKPCFQGK